MPKRNNSHDARSRIDLEINHVLCAPEWILLQTEREMLRGGASVRKFSDHLDRAVDRSLKASDVAPILDPPSLGGLNVLKRRSGPFERVMPHPPVRTTRGLSITH